MLDVVVSFVVESKLELPGLIPGRLSTFIRGCSLITSVVDVRINKKQTTLLYTRWGYCMQVSLGSGTIEDHVRPCQNFGFVFHYYYCYY